MDGNPLWKVMAFREAGRIGALEVQFVRTMARLGGEQDPLVLLGAALACLAPSKGHICLELPRARHLVRQEAREGEPADPAKPPDPGAEWPDLDAWRSALEACADRPGAILRRSGPGRTPLVLEGDRLYLDRYWDFEQRLVRKIFQWTGADGKIDPGGDVQDLIDRLFPSDRPGADGLRNAARAVATRRFSIIAGGPGTGKTTTVTRILAMLLELSRRQAPEGEWIPPRIALMAPTGKAAARMKESIRDELAKLPACAGTGIDPAALAQIRVEASTIHRQIGVTPDHPTRPRFGQDNQLPVDIAIVDEASMVDFALMTRLVEAIPRSARLVLLGDRDQLASVEAGAVLGDLCGIPDAGRRDGLDAPGIASSVAFLRYPFRFGPDSGIGALSRAIRNRQPDQALAYLRRERVEEGAPADQREYRDLVFVEVKDEAPADDRAPRHRGRSPDGFDRVKDVVVTGFEAFVREARAGRAAAALEERTKFCVLTPHRRGRLGVEGLNERIERWMSAEGRRLIDPSTPWYVGRPILVTENDASLELFNGDLGVIVAGENGEPRAAFPGRVEGEIRLLHPGRLPPHETVYALTVHKSQGSQFQRILLVLPDKPSPILTRELLYTGVTRAAEEVRVVGNEATIRAAIGEEVLRFSGLREKVWGPEGTPDSRRD